MVRKKLNIGCGKDIKKGYINLDVLDLPGVDVVHDLNKRPYPFADNEFDEILCIAILEHVVDLSSTMLELHRLLKEGGLLKIVVPHFSSSIMFADPTHKNFLSYHSFDFFCGDSFYYSFRFKLLRRRLIFGKKFAFWNWVLEPFANVFPRIYEDTPLRAFPALNIHVVLRK